MTEMREYKQIEVGDSVYVWINDDTNLGECLVKHIPIATGDCWHLQAKLDGQTWYVQQFQTIQLKAAPPQKGE